MRFALLTVLVSVLATATPVIAGPPDAATIAQRMKAALEPERSSIRTLVLAMSSAAVPAADLTANQKKVIEELGQGQAATTGSTTEWAARQARKKLPDGNRILTVILAPDEVKGVAFLIWERKDKPDEQWLYLPAVRRVRKLTPVSAYESFLGTDFTFADLGFVNLRARKFSLLGEETVAGTPAYKIQETLAGPAFYYSRIVTWVAKDSTLPLRRDYYDPANQLWKTELYQDVAVIDGTPTVMRIRMQDKFSDTSTELRVSKVRYDAVIPDDLFDPQKLPQVSKHPLWTQAAP
jgi:outer membrane lipoprotein-sorting protein